MHCTLLYTGIRYRYSGISFPWLSMGLSPIKVTTMVKGETVVAASFTLFAKAETSAIMDTSTMTVDRMIRSSIAKSIGVYTEESTPVSSPPIIFGSAAKVPIKLEQPARSAIILKENTLPSARELLFMGVTSKVAMVPRSFSPAMDSGATDMQPLYKNIISSRGIIMENICPVVSLLVAQS